MLTVIKDSSENKIILSNISLGGTPGQDGVGIVDVTLIDGDSSPGSTDIYAINMSNLDTYTFNVYNGKDGVDGKDASELNIDAINVSFDNSSTDLIDRKSVV